MELHDREQGVRVVGAQEPRCDRVGEAVVAQLEDPECGQVPQDPPERGAVGTDGASDVGERTGVFSDGVGDSEAGDGVLAPRVHVGASRASWTWRGWSG